MTRRQALNQIIRGRDPAEMQQASAASRRRKKAKSLLEQKAREARLQEFERPEWWDK